MRCYIWDLSRPAELIAALNELRTSGEVQFVRILWAYPVEFQAHVVSEVEEFYSPLQLPGEEFLFDLTDNLKSLIVKRKETPVDVDAVV